MFNLEEALSTIDGRYLSFADLRSAMTDIRIRHLSELPPEVGVDELIRIGRQKSFISEGADGKMHIQVAEFAGK